MMQKIAHVFGFAVGVAGFMFAASAADSETPLSDVIRNVRENEALYADIEVFLRSTYEITDRADDKLVNDHGRIEIKKSQTAIRYVSQGAWFRLEESQSTTTAVGNQNGNGMSCFNGERTKMHFGEVGNIHDRRVEDTRFVRPHMLLLRDMSYGVPLSVYLSGAPAIRAHPLNHLAPDVDMSITYNGPADINGEPCRKVLVELGTKDQPRFCGELLWLSEHRNYLPLRIEHFSYRASETTPSGVATANEIKELQPGISLPMEFTILSFDKLQLKETGEQKIRWRRQYTVESARLDPDYGKSYFEGVRFPEGTAVYEVNADGQIRKSWREGAPTSPSARLEGGLYLSWGFVLINIVLVLSIAAFCLRGRRGRTGIAE